MLILGIQNYLSFIIYVFAVLMTILYLSNVLSNNRYTTKNIYGISICSLILCATFAVKLIYSVYQNLSKITRYYYIYMIVVCAALFAFCTIILEIVERKEEKEKMESKANK